MFWTSRITAENMQPMFLYGKNKKKLPKGQAELWSAGPKNSPKRVPQYLDEVDPKYAKTLASPITQSTIGWNVTATGRFEPMFIFLKSKIEPEFQVNALKELQRVPSPFKTCKKSGRPELMQAVRYNGHKNPEASEWNPGYREKKRFGHFEIAGMHGDLTNYPDLKALLKEMGKVFQHFYPRKFGHALTLCPARFRLAGMPYSRLAILKSAASAIHVDSDNGMGVACMTTIEDPDDHYNGGVFCFVEYGIQIAVRPGDMLIANTPAHWHCNVAKITGTKYSIVAYFTKRLGTSQIMNDKWREQTDDDYETFEERETRYWGRVGLPRPKRGMFD